MNEFNAIRFCCWSVAFLLTANIGISQVWEPGLGTSGLNMQALFSADGWDYSGGETGTYRSNDAGSTFTDANVGNSSIGPTRGFTSDDTYMYQCTSNGVFRSADYGANWTSVDNGLPQLLSHGMARTADRIWVVTPTGVFHSTDHGDNWNSGGLDGLDVRCITTIGDDVYVGTQGEGLFRSVDNGVNWEAINNGSTSTTFRAIESHGDILFAGGQIGTGVFCSTDFGASWTLLSNGLPGGSFRGFAAHDNWIVAGSFGNGVYVSVDQGDSWVALNEALGDLTIFDVTFNDTHLLAATNSQGTWRLGLAALPQTSSLNDHQPLRSLLYPNPADRWVYVATEWAGRTVAVFSADGRLNETLSFDGATNRRINTSHWPPGCYTLQAEGQLASQLIIQHD